MLHKPKVCTNKMAYGKQNGKRTLRRTLLVKLYSSYSQHHQGRAISNKVWVGWTRSRPALRYMEIVPCRDANTLLPIIQAHTLPGTIIHSDQWSPYSRVQLLPNVATLYCKSLHRVCEPHDWGSHAACGVVLEQGKDKVQAYERLPPGAATELLGQVHVAKVVWDNHKLCSGGHH